MLHITVYMYHIFFIHSEGLICNISWWQKLFLEWGRWSRVETESHVAQFAKWGFAPGFCFKPGAVTWQKHWPYWADCTSRAPCVPGSQASSPGDPMYHWTWHEQLWAPAPGKPHASVKKTKSSRKKSWKPNRKEGCRSPRPTKQVTVSAGGWATHQTVSQGFVKRKMGP